MHNMLLCPLQSGPNYHLEVATDLNLKKTKRKIRTFIISSLQDLKLLVYKPDSVISDIIIGYNQIKSETDFSIIRDFFQTFKTKQELDRNPRTEVEMTCNFLVRGSAPILSPPMNGLNHLRKQCTNTLIDQVLEEMYAGFIV